MFKLLAGRQPSDDELASQPTLSRFENAIDVASLNRLRDVFVDQFLNSFDQPPRRLTFDIDTFDDPTHGAQQLTFFHGYYEQYQYQPRLITCAQNDQVVMACLLHGTAHAALGADDDLKYLTARVRAQWPDVVIEVRGDSGMAIPVMYEVCERLGLQYTLGLKLNSVLKARSDALLAQAVARHERTSQPQRLFTGFWYQAQSWAQPRWVVMKAEANSQGTNRRAVITNRPGGPVLPQAAYDDYAERGESENRNKEIKCGMEGDRLSDHRYMANLFRLYMHAAALNLLVRLRSCVADPPPQNALRNCRVKPRPAGATAILQPAPRARSVGRRASLHVANATDQGRGTNQGNDTARVCPTERQLALSGPLPSCEPSGSRAFCHRD